VALDVAAQIQFWLAGSKDDLEAARALLSAHKVGQAGFFLHLAIEKAIKDTIVGSTCDVPPRSHDLLLLFKRAGEMLTEPRRDFVGRVQVYCLEGRYTTELPPAPAEKTVAEDLEIAAEIIQWLNSRLNNL